MLIMDLVSNVLNTVPFDLELANAVIMARHGLEADFEASTVTYEFAGTICGI